EDGESGVEQQLAELVEVGLVHAVVEELGAHLGGHRVGQEAAGLTTAPGTRPTQIRVHVGQSSLHHHPMGVAAPLHVGTGRVHHPCECLVVGVEQPLGFCAVGGGEDAAVPAAGGEFVDDEGAAGG